jgi:hypothetical protein
MAWWGIKQNKPLKNFKKYGDIVNMGIRLTLVDTSYSV